MKDIPAFPQQDDASGSEGMTLRDQIIRMAREAGMPPVEIISDKPVLYPVPDAIERFFHAAYTAGAAAELEAK